MNTKLVMASLLLATTISAHADFWSRNFTNPVKRLPHNLVEKPIHWIGLKSGITPTVDNANDAANAAANAADQVATTVAEAKARLLPRVEAFLDIINQTWGYVVGSFLTLMMMICLLIVPKVIVAWKYAVGDRTQKTANFSGGTPSHA